MRDLVISIINIFLTFITAVGAIWAAFAASRSVKTAEQASDQELRRPSWTRLLSLLYTQRVVGLLVPIR
jgi:hypothetical protein